MRAAKVSKTTHGAHVCPVGPITWFNATTFYQAADMVRQLAAEGVAEIARPRTIGEMMDAYVAAANKTKGARSMQTIEAHVKLIDPFPAEVASTCTLPRLNAWKADLIIDKRGPATVNKIIGTQ